MLVIDLLSRGAAGKCSRFREQHSPSVTDGFRVAMTGAVLMPERFRGCCPFGATYRHRAKAVDSPAPPFQQRPDYSEWTSDPGLHTLFSW